MLEEWRCPQCRHILLRFRPMPGFYAEIKCLCNAYCTKEIAAASTNGYNYLGAVSALMGQPSTGHLTGER